jgi:outer membrane protein with glycine zipper
MGLCRPADDGPLAPRRLYGNRGATNGVALGVESDGRFKERMTRILALSAALAAALSVSACETPQQQNAFAGGALGAGTGAIIGSAVSHGSAGGALAGAAIGAGSGALLGSAMTPQPTYYGGGPPPAYAGGPPPGRCAQWAYDYNGNRVCTAFY